MSSWLTFYFGILVTLIFDVETKTMYRMYPIKALANSVIAHNPSFLRLHCPLAVGLPISSEGTNADELCRSLPKRRKRLFMAVLQ